MQDQEEGAEQLEQLRKTQEEFEKFLKVVEDDLSEKVEKLKEFKKDRASGRSEKNYATLQLFMLSKYVNRVGRFKEVAEKSLNEINEEKVNKIETDSDKLSNKITNHIHDLAKMKRRMKHMIDVSDKHAVIDDIDTNQNVNKDFVDGVDETDGVGDIEKSSAFRMTKRTSTGSTSSEEGDISIDSFSPFSSPSTSPMPPKSDFSEPSLTSSSPSTSTSFSSTSPDPSEDRSPVMRMSRSTMKSFTDHLSVLTRTYTNRK